MNALIWLSLSSIAIAVLSPILFVVARETGLFDRAPQPAFARRPRGPHGPR